LSPATPRRAEPRTARTGRARAATPWHGRQYHYLSADSHVHPFLVDLWNEVRDRTGGKLSVSVHAGNEGLTGSHLEIVERLIHGDIEFYVLMGGILGHLVPPFEIQGLPFAFDDHAQVHAALDGVLGEYLRAELLAKGVYALPHGLLENGFRHISTVRHPVATVDDLMGLRIRIPEGRMFEDAFESFGARPIQLNILGMRQALADGSVDGQENPLAVTEALKLHEVTRFVSLTCHMWSGFNLLASARFWRALPARLQDTVLACVARHVARQRDHTDALNRDLETRLVMRGMTVLRPERAAFRTRLVSSGFYQRWKKRVGRRAWGLLEQSVGHMG
jgi:tripartite ATP-independent transporter DctP family solute receptor